VSISGQTPALAPGLYVVSTPIGNLRDVTLRALDVLSAADLLACEDTRISGRLLAHYEIDRPLTAYHEHNAREARPKLLERLAGGAAIALISDAGTPAVSDPGYKLIAEARSAGIPVHAVPGASALTAALAVAGLPTDAVAYLGFLPAKAAARRRKLRPFAGVPASLVVYESPHRLAKTLADLAAVLGPREAALCRELTKRFEEVRRGSLPDLAERYGDATVKGEIVLVIAPPAEESSRIAPDDADSALKAALETLSVKEAAAAVAWLTGKSRRSLYQRALALKSGED